MRLQSEEEIDLKLNSYTIKAKNSRSLLTVALIWEAKLASRYQLQRRSIME